MLPGHLTFFDGLKDSQLSPMEDACGAGSLIRMFFAWKRFIICEAVLLVGCGTLGIRLDETRLPLSKASVAVFLRRHAGYPEATSLP
jgi:hypothetical protein